MKLLNQTCSKNCACRTKLLNQMCSNWWNRSLYICLYWTLVSSVMYIIITHTYTAVTLPKSCPGAWLTKIMQTKTHSFNPVMSCCVTQGYRNCMPYCSYISQHLFKTCTILLEGDKASTLNFDGETTWEISTWKISDRRATLLNSLLRT